MINTTNLAPYLVWLSMAERADKASFDQRVRAYCRQASPRLSPDLTRQRMIAELEDRQIINIAIQLATGYYRNARDCRHMSEEKLREYVYGQIHVQPQNKRLPGDSRELGQ